MQLFTGQLIGCVEKEIVSPKIKNEFEDLNEWPQDH
jgi:hypothetical protein